LTPAQKSTVKQEVNALLATQLQQQRTVLSDELANDPAIDSQALEGFLRSLPLATQLKAYRFEICEACNTINSQSADQLLAIRRTIAGRIGGTTELEVDEYKLSLIDARLDTVTATPEASPEASPTPLAATPQVEADPQPQVAPTPADTSPEGAPIPAAAPAATESTAGAATTEPATPTTTTTESSGSSVMFSASLDVTESRKFAFEASGASKIDALLVSTPPPTALLDALRIDAQGRAKKAVDS
jgi:hypothetical protein